jgi:hypothetical protein
MRQFDKLISSLMWASIASAFLVILGVLAYDVYKTDWRYTVALCLLWLPPALSLGHAEQIPGRQSSLFYLFAALTLAWAVGLLAYGVYFYEGFS